MMSNQQEKILARLWAAADVPEGSYVEVPLLVVIPQGL